MQKDLTNHYIPVKDGRFFAWVRDTSLWAEPKLSPQLFIDTEVAKYLINHQNTQSKLEIVGNKHVLELNQYNLTLDQLAKKYPAPITPSTDSWDNGAD